MDNRHECARSLFDDVVCDLPEHAGIGCFGCIPYVHADGSVDHESSCISVVSAVTIEKDSDAYGAHRKCLICGKSLRSHSKLEREACEAAL